MKLQLNHIQHYPIGENGLKMIFLKSGRIIELHGTWLNGNGNLIFVSSDGEYFLQKHWDFKPILSPLSDYKDVNSKAMSELNCDVMDMIRISELANQRIGLSSVQYGVIEIMCDNHIDFNRLIESGLAIDINTLNK